MAIKRMRENEDLISDFIVVSYLIKIDVPQYFNQVDNLLL